MAKMVFLGAGRMASAMINGLLRTDMCGANDVACTSADDGTGPALATKTGITYSPDAQSLLPAADTVILAFKPQQLKDMPATMAEATTGRLIISILAGSPIHKLREKFPSARAIVRAMPNTPGQIGAGVTAYATSQSLTPEDTAIVEKVLGALGKVIPLQENLLDAVTGVSGSGPAYVFEFVAALRDGGIAAGLPADIAYSLAVETVAGAAALLKAVPETPETHRDWVSSPGGTTLAGLAVMQTKDFRSTLKDTVLAATHRSRELAGS